MGAEPVVSIVMPLYNKRPYVKRAIDSIRSQTFTNWELIVVDDGSTDGSAEEMPGDDPRIRLFRQENKGPSATRNRGIEMASGEFVTFLDADDYFYPQKLEVEMDLLRNQQKAEWMMSAYEYEIANELKGHCIKDIHGNDVSSSVMVFESALDNLKVEGWPSDGLCVKKSLLDRTGGFNEGLHYCEITELIIRCAVAQPRVVIYHEPLYRVVDVPKSISKVLSYRNESFRQMGESFHLLSRNYPEFAGELIRKSRLQLYSYIAGLILSGRAADARDYLVNSFPCGRDRRWWKMWIGSWIPAAVLRRIVKTDLSLAQMR